MTVPYDELLATLTPQQQAEVRAARTAQDTASSNLDNAVATLRQWASDARNTTVTAGNVVAVTQTMVNRVGTFFDRFADLLVAQGRQ